MGCGGGSEIWGQQEDQTDQTEAFKEKAAVFKGWWLSRAG